ncbi:MAG: FAD-binding oxidoreductase [Anaerolineaceae bacterium]|nr:FAD-binding oxidoreductase [Anaerolineaceae bacterium]
MTDNYSYDVIIIGAGSIGVPAALAMAKEGLKVLVLDKMPSPGQGCNKTAIGGVRATHTDPAKIRLGLRSIEIFSTWEETYGQDIEWVTGGYTFVAYSEKEEQTLKNLLEIQKSHHLNIDWVDTSRMKQLVPGINDNGLLGGTFSADDGYCSTLLSSYAFFSEAQKAGTEFHFQEEVKGLIINAGRIQGVKTNKGQYNAPHVLNAAGAYANEIGSLAGMKHPVRPDSHEAGITEPVAHFLDPLVVDIRPGPGSANCYFYQAKTGQIIFCITPQPNIWGLDIQETSEFLPMASRRLISIIPKLSNIRVRRTWRGLYPMTPDGFPLVGQASEVPGYWMAIGLCGQGFMLGPAIGELLARSVSGQQLSGEDQMILDRLSPYRDFESQEALK